MIFIDDRIVAIWKVMDCGRYSLLGKLLRARVYELEFFRNLKFWKRNHSIPLQNNSQFTKLLVLPKLFHLTGSTTNICAIVLALLLMVICRF